ncbi:GNAT family N-acetyltransferase [Curvibacter sp. RS43]|uniref:GNAT family N-acetyltransferase n=1 Tax=Curvibacter microcysteis TaxID=3026419 RepID=UPI0023620D1E|nr:GNAT family N-acetyltransferase [Curvibacter sp. RS43]MDD0812906.1 GNAT family N-acetyltransferase [Curvibacter sp. RS43]
MATQVSLHTYCTNGVNTEVAQYVLSELTVERFAVRLTEPQSHILVGEFQEWLVGFAAARFGASCPSIAKSTVELQTLYVQEHFIGQGIGRSLLEAAEAKAHEEAAAPPDLSPAQIERVSKLSAAELVLIDEALMSQVSREWRKVARV